MRLKTYFASSVEAAMLLALEQLGPEAMIVNSRRLPEESRHLGEYEVVFSAAPDLDADPGVAEDRAEQAVSEGQDREPVRRLYGEVSRLAAEIESLSRVMKRTEAKQRLANCEGEQAEVAHSFAEAGFSEHFTLDALSGASAAEGGSLRFRVLQSIVERLGVAPTLGKTGHGRKVAALVGPAGVGKSSLVAKLATRFGVAARRSCQILSFDSERVGASEPLRIVAGVLGVGFRMIEEPAMLNAALDSVRDRDLVLIDTPGFARDETEALEDLAAALAGRAEIDVHLALPATMKLHDLARTIQLYREIKPERLVFTRLDETDQIGTLIESALFAELPVSFLSSGPRVPEDLELANSSQLARRAFLQSTLFFPPLGGRTRRAAA